MEHPLLEAQGLTRHFGGVCALDDVSCAVRAGTTLGVIGPNGSGKTTLFDVLTGFTPPEAGSVKLLGADVTGFSPHRRAGMGLLRTFQQVRLVRRETALQNVMLAFRRQAGERLWWAVAAPLAWGQAERSLRTRALDLLGTVGLAEKASQPAGALSYGQQKLLSLCCCTAAGGKVFLLDEPTAGVAPAMLEVILGVLERMRGQGKAMVLIEHNLDVVEQLCDQVLFLEAGRVLVSGTPTAVRGDPRALAAYVR